MTQKNAMIVVLSFPIIFSCYDIYYGRNGIIKCLSAASVRGGVAKEIKVIDHDEFGAVPSLGCSLVSYYAWMLWNYTMLV